MSRVAVGPKKIDPLRQQLDELDLLMQRMLSVGVNQTPVEKSIEAPEEAASENPQIPVENAPAIAEVAGTEPEVSAVQNDLVVSQPVESAADLAEPESGSVPQPEQVVSSGEQTEVLGEPEPEPIIELAFRAPTFVSLDSFAMGGSAALYAEFQFSSQPSEPARGEQPSEPPRNEQTLELANEEPAALFEVNTPVEFVSPAEPAVQEQVAVPEAYPLVQFAPPPSEPAIEERAAVAEANNPFQFAPPPSEPTIEQPLAASPAQSTTAQSKPIIFVAWWLRPLAIVNGIYDGSTRWLGPIGRGLRSRPMRNLLGICGLAALIGAVAWVLWEGTDWNS